MTPRCRLGCGNAVAVTGSKCGACIRRMVEQGHDDEDAARRAQLHDGLQKVRAALADARRR